MQRLSMNLIEGVDWYRDEETGAFVWTAKYLADRGFCCNGGCRHCPYEENGVLRPVETIVIRHEDSK
jgi:hypothetical protein